MRCAGSVHESDGANIRSWSTYAFRVGPVVGDLGRRVEPHDVRRSAGTGLGLLASLARRVRATRVADLDQRPELPVHRAVIDRDPRRLHVVRAAFVEHVLVVVRPTTCPVRLRVADADIEPTRTGFLRDAVGAGERPEVVIERTVLLDDEDQVIQVLDAERRIDGVVRGAAAAASDRGASGVASPASAPTIPTTRSDVHNHARCSDRVFQPSPRARTRSGSSEGCCVRQA